MPEGEPQSTTINVWADNVPEQSNLNPWATTVEDGGLTYFTELSSLNFIEEFEPKLHGQSYEASWIDWEDEIEIPMLIEDFEIEPPHDTYEKHNDDLTYWDGTPITAEARVKEDHVYYFDDGYKFDDTATFNSEVTDRDGDQWYHTWSDKGEVDGQQPNPLRREVLLNDAAPNLAVPFHPDFTTPYVEDFEEASTQEAVDSVAEDLAGDNVDFTRFAEEGWGSGLYEIQDPSSDIAQDAITATRRDDHPNEHATIDEVTVNFATADRRQVLLEQGEEELGGGIVAEREGEITRQLVPDHIQEIDRYFQNGGDRVLFNFNNPHLKNLWVRRAIVAAIDWRAVGVNGWGAERSIPTEIHNGLLDSVSEAAFSEDFLDSLYQYPIRQDLELAAEWMERAGYTQEGNTWVSPDGEAFESDILVNTGIQDWVPAGQTISYTLQNFGAETEFRGLGWGQWDPAMNHDSNNFDMAVMWHGMDQPWQHYYTDGSVWVKRLLDGESTEENEIDRDTDAEQDTLGRPLNPEIPSEVGSIEAPDQAGRVPDLPNGEEIDLPELVYSLRDGRTDDETYQENLRKITRYVNFYVPEFVFHQYSWGVFGNVRDFSFPERGHEINRTWKDFGAEDFFATGGVAQLKFDDEYRDP